MLPQDMFVIQAGGPIPKDFTGKFVGNLDFKDGIAYTNKWIWVKLATIKGCHEVTPPAVRQRLLSRPLNRILVIRNAAYGDGLIITPAIRALREKYPKATIHLYGRSDSRIVYEGIPYIDGLINIRETELAILFDDYDEVFDMVHSIECRPEADFMNALDVACGIMAVPTPSDPLPTYVPTQEELTKCTEMLRKLGVSSKDKIIVLQAEATARVRTLPPTTSLQVANHFATKGYKVLMVGHDIPLMNTYLSHCPSCKREVAFHSPNGQPLPYHCPVCKQDRVFSPYPNHPNVIFLHKVYHQYPARVHFAVAGMAKLIIAVDSLWSHLAAALRIPSVLIYSNYHPYTRTKYYDLCTVVHPDYNETVACGPCNSLVGFCHMYPEVHAPCTTTIPVEEIISAATERLSGVTPLWQSYRDTAPTSYSREETRPCPVCQSTKHTLVSCKGSFIYVRCFDCDTIFTAKYPDSGFWKKLPSRVRGKKFYRPSRMNKVEDLLNGLSAALKEVKVELPPDCQIADLVGQIEDPYCGRPSYATLSSRFKQYNEQDSSPIREKLVLWIEGLCELEDPGILLRRIWDRMAQDAVLAVISPCADRYNGINAWAGLNAVVAGLNTIVPSGEGFKRLLSEAGFSNIQIAFNDVNAMVVAKK